MATKRSNRRKPSKDPRQMTADELARAIAEIERKIDLLDSFEQSEEWKIIAQHVDERLRKAENVGKGLRRRLMSPVEGLPAITLEQIASHEARIDEMAKFRRLPVLILAGWRAQLEQAHAIRAGGT